MASSPQELNNISANQLDSADTSIYTNLQVQAFTLVCCVLSLFIIRRKFLWLYSPNTRSRLTHPAYAYTKRTLKWIFPIFFVDDVTILSIVGLDCFMLLQVMKMMYRIFFFLTLLCIPLMYIYYQRAMEVEPRVNLFVRFTIKFIDRSEMQLVPVLYVYLIVFVLFYVVYVYYKKYITLRQTYIRSPSLLTPLTVLKRTSLVTEDFIDLVDMKSRSVMLLRIPDFVTTDIKLRMFVEALGCGEVEECALIIDSTKVDGYIDLKDCYVREVEDHFERAYRDILSVCEEKSLEGEDLGQISDIIKKMDDRKYKKEIEVIGCKDSNDEEDEPISQDETLTDEESESTDQITNDSRKSDRSLPTDPKRVENEGNHQNKLGYRIPDIDNAESRSHMKLNAYARSRNYPDAKFPKNKPNSYHHNKDRNIRLARRFIESQSKYLPVGIHKALTSIDNIQTKIVEYVRSERYKPKECPEGVIEMMNANNAMYARIDLQRDAPFFSLSQILRIRETLHYFTLDLPLHTRSGFVTFKSQRAASILTQCLISSKIFCCTAYPAPDPKDVIWENVAQGEVNRFFKRIGGNIVNILFVGVFYTLVLGVSKVMKIEQLESALPSIQWLTQYSTVRNLYNSTVMPFIFNQMMGLAPMVLTLLIYYEGVVSYSELHYKLVEKHTYFLLFNGFIAMLFSATCFEVFLKIASGEIGLKQTVEDVAKNLIIVSVFFTNSIIQRIFGGVAFRLLKPSALFIELIWTKLSHKIFKTVRTRRTILEAARSAPVHFGIEYPTAILVFPMALCYAVIAPLMLPLACIFFLCTYFVLKHELLYCIESISETGGSHWAVITNQMVLSLYIFILATMCQYLLSDTRWILLLLLPAIVVTYMFKRAMNTMFKRCATAYPLNEQEEIYMDSFVASVTAYRKQAVQNWDEGIDPEDPDSIEVTALLGKKHGDDDAEEIEKLIKEKDIEFKQVKNKTNPASNDINTNDKNVQHSTGKHFNTSKDFDSHKFGPGGSPENSSNNQEFNKDSEEKDLESKDGKGSTKNSDKSFAEGQGSVKNGKDTGSTKNDEKSENNEHKSLEDSSIKGSNSSENPKDNIEVFANPGDQSIVKFDANKALSYPYRGVVRGYRKFILPSQFFRKLRLIAKIDTHDKLEIFKPQPEV